VLCVALCEYITSALIIYVSGKTGLIAAHLQVSRNADFKYSSCCSLPMMVDTSDVPISLFTNRSDPDII